MDFTQVLLSESFEEAAFQTEKIPVATLEIEGIYHTIYNTENTIGRVEDNNIVINNNAISSKHAVIEADDPNSHLLYDLGSTNKTKLGKLTLKPHVRYLINDGDNITFGNISAIYNISKQLPRTPEKDNLDTVPETPGKYPNVIPESPEISQNDESALGNKSDTDIFDEKSLDTSTPCKSNTVIDDTTKKDISDDIYELDTLNFEELEILKQHISDEKPNSLCKVQNIKDSDIKVIGDSDDEAESIYNLQTERFDEKIMDCESTIQNAHYLHNKKDTEPNFSKAAGMVNVDINVTNDNIVSQINLDKTGFKKNKMEENSCIMKTEKDIKLLERSSIKVVTIDNLNENKLSSVEAEWKNISASDNLSLKCDQQPLDEDVFIPASQNIDMFETSGKDEQNTSINDNFDNFSESGDESMLGLSTQQIKADLSESMILLNDNEDFDFQGPSENANVLLVPESQPIADTSLNLKNISVSKIEETLTSTILSNIFESSAQFTINDKIVSQDFKKNLIPDSFPSNDMDKKALQPTLVPEVKLNEHVTECNSLVSIQNSKNSINVNIEIDQRKSENLSFNEEIYQAETQLFVEEMDKSLPNVGVSEMVKDQDANDVSKIDPEGFKELSNETFKKPNNIITRDSVLTEDLSTADTEPLQSVDNTNIINDKKSSEYLDDSIIQETDFTFTQGFYEAETQPFVDESKIKDTLQESASRKCTDSVGDVEKLLSLNTVPIKPIQSTNNEESIRESETLKIADGKSTENTGSTDKPVLDESLSVSVCEAATQPFNVETANNITSHNSDFNTKQLLVNEHETPSKVNNDVQVIKKVVDIVKENNETSDKSLKLFEPDTQPFNTESLNDIPKNSSVKLLAEYENGLYEIKNNLALDSLQKDISKNALIRGNEHDLIQDTEQCTLLPVMQLKEHDSNFIRVNIKSENLSFNEEIYQAETQLFVEEMDKSLPNVGVSEMVKDQDANDVSKIDPEGFKELSNETFKKPKNIITRDSVLTKDLSTADTEPLQSVDNTNIINDKRSNEYLDNSINKETDFTFTQGFYEAETQPFVAESKINDTLQESASRKRTDSVGDVEKLLSLNTVSIKPIQSKNNEESIRESETLKIADGKSTENTGSTDKPVLDESLSVSVCEAATQPFNVETANNITSHNSDFNTKQLLVNEHETPSKVNNDVQVIKKVVDIVKENNETSDKSLKLFEPDTQPFNTESSKGSAKLINDAKGQTVKDGDVIEKKMVSEQIVNNYAKKNEPSIKEAETLKITDEKTTGNTGFIDEPVLDESLCVYEAATQPFNVETADNITNHNSDFNTKQPLKNEHETPSKDNNDIHVIKKIVNSEKENDETSDISLNLFEAVTQPFSGESSISTPKQSSVQSVTSYRIVCNEIKNNLVSEPLLCGNTDKNALLNEIPPDLHVAKDLIRDIEQPTLVTDVNLNEHDSLLSVKNSQESIEIVKKKSENLSFNEEIYQAETQLFVEEMDKSLPNVGVSGMVKDQDANDVSKINPEGFKELSNETFKKPDNIKRRDSVLTKDSSTADTEPLKSVDNTNIINDKRSNEYLDDDSIIKETDFTFTQGFYEAETQPFVAESKTNSTLQESACSKRTDSDDEPILDESLSVYEAATQPFSVETAKNITNNITNHERDFSTKQSLVNEHETPSKVNNDVQVIKKVVDVVEENNETSDKSSKLFEPDTQPFNTESSKATSKLINDAKGQTAKDGGVVIEKKIVSEQIINNESFDLNNREGSSLICTRSSKINKNIVVPDDSTVESSQELILKFKKNKCSMFPADIEEFSESSELYDENKALDNSMKKDNISDDADKSSEEFIIKFNNKGCAMFPADTQDFNKDTNSKIDLSSTCSKDEAQIGTKKSSNAKQKSIKYENKNEESSEEFIIKFNKTNCNIFPPDTQEDFESGVSNIKNSQKTKRLTRKQSLKKLVTDSEKRPLILNTKDSENSEKDSDTDTPKKSCGRLSFIAHGEINLHSDEDTEEIDEVFRTTVAAMSPSKSSVESDSNESGETDVPGIRVRRSERKRKVVYQPLTESNKELTPEVKTKKKKNETNKDNFKLKNRSTTSVLDEQDNENIKQKKTEIESISERKLTRSVKKFKKTITSTSEVITPVKNMPTQEDIKPLKKRESYDSQNDSQSSLSNLDDSEGYDLGRGKRKRVKTSFDGFVLDEDLKKYRKKLVDSPTPDSQLTKCPISGNEKLPPAKVNKDYPQLSSLNKNLTHDVSVILHDFNKTSSHKNAPVRSLVSHQCDDIIDDDLILPPPTKKNVSLKLNKTKINSSPKAEVKSSQSFSFCDKLDELFDIWGPADRVKLSPRAAKKPLKVQESEEITDMNNKRGKNFQNSTNNKTKEIKVVQNKKSGAKEENVSINTNTKKTSNIAKKGIKINKNKDTEKELTLKHKIVEAPSEIPVEKRRRRKTSNSDTDSVNSMKELKTVVKIVTNETKSIDSSKNDETRTNLKMKIDPYIIPKKTKVSKENSLTKNKSTALPKTTNEDNPTKMKEPKRTRNSYKNDETSGTVELSSPSTSYSDCYVISQEFSFNEKTLNNQMPKDDRFKAPQAPIRRSSRSKNAEKKTDIKMAEKVLFSGFSDRKLSSLVSNLGGEIVTSPFTCTVLVTDKVKRTTKFLCAVGRGLPIVTPEWLHHSNEAGAFSDVDKFIVCDKEAEKQFSFKLKETLKKATSTKLLDGWSIFVTSTVKPPPEEIKSIIECCGGKYLSKEPARWGSNSFIISCVEDKSEWNKLKKRGKTPPIVKTEALFSGILQHKLDFESYRLV